MHSTTPGMESSEPVSMAPLFPVMPIAVRPAPGMGCARNPIASICSQTARTCSSVAFDCITTSMGGSLEQRRNGKFSLFRGGEAKTLYGRTIEYFGGAGRDRTADKGFADLCLTTWRPRHPNLHHDSSILSGGLLDLGSGAQNQRHLASPVTAIPARNQSTANKHRWTIEQLIA